MAAFLTMGDIGRENPMHVGRKVERKYISVIKKSKINEYRKSFL